MNETKSFAVKNLDLGPRGLWSNGESVSVPAGALLPSVPMSEGEFQAAKATGWFEFSAAQDAGPEAPQPPAILTPAELDKLSNAKLREYLVAHNREPVDSANRGDMLTAAKSIT